MSRNLNKTKYQALMKTVKNNPKEKSFCIEFICNGFALKRDAFYKYRKRYATQKKIEKTVIELVHKSRQTLPREGTRKLMKSLKNDFQENNLKIGRDQFWAYYFNA
jgi:putative transposase